MEEHRKIKLLKMTLRQTDIVRYFNMNQKKKKNVTDVHAMDQKPNPISIKD